MAEAAAGPTSAAVPPVVVVVGQMQLSKVDVSQDVRVPHQVRLPVVVEVVPRDGDPVAATDRVELTIVVVRTNLLGELRLEFIVIDPDAGAVLDGDAVVADDEADGEVANDHIGRIGDLNTI